MRRAVSLYGVTEQSLPMLIGAWGNKVPCAWGSLLAGRYVLVVVVAVVVVTTGAWFVAAGRGELPSKVSSERLFFLNTNFLNMFFLFFWCNCFSHIYK